MPIADCIVKRRLSYSFFLLQTEQSTTRPDECYHFRNVTCQAYKTPDHKVYKQKYPDSCFSKPILKK